MYYHWASPVIVGLSYFFIFRKHYISTVFIFISYIVCTIYVSWHYINSVCNVIFVPSIFFHAFIIPIWLWNRHQYNINANLYFFPLTRWTFRLISSLIYLLDQAHSRIGRQYHKNLENLVLSHSSLTFRLSRHCEQLNEW